MKDLRSPLKKKRTVKEGVVFSLKIKKDERKQKRYKTREVHP